LLEQIPAVIEEAYESRNQVPVDVGRYDIVCAPMAVAGTMNTTIGVATELDRAMGYEANADGTSYLDQPLEMLGTYHVGSPLLTVTANRSQAGGAATVKWDDEAVEPEEFTLVKDGVLADYQTTREQATWLTPWYQKTGRAVRSHGCANTMDAQAITLQNAPNLQFMPGAQDVSFDDLVAGTSKGYALLDAGQVMMDPQQLNGLIVGTMREIIKGKLGRFVYGSALDVRAPDFWKTLKAIGGAKQTQWFGFQSSKGEPMQSNYHSVGAVPAKFENTAIIDLMRKA
jgi:TldD protein